MKSKKFSTSFERREFLSSKLAEAGIASIKDEAFIEPAFIGSGDIGTFDEYREAAAMHGRFPGWISRDELFEITEHLLREDFAEYQRLHEHVE